MNSCEKVEAKHRVRAGTSEDTGLFFLMVVCSASGHYTIPKTGTETRVCLIWAKFKLEIRRVFLVSNPNTVKVAYLGGLQDHKSSFL